MPLRLGRRRMDSKERNYDVSDIVSRDIIRSRCIYAVVQKSLKENSILSYLSCQTFFVRWHFA